MIVSINTHPIVVGMHEEYDINWCGKIIDTKPKFKNGLPIFDIISHEGSAQLNTVDMELIERTAKKLTNPHGKKAVATDKAWIYIVEENDTRTLLGIVTHNHIKEYRQMYDDFEWR